jgi:hypothetical protein
MWDCRPTAVSTSWLLRLPVFAIVRIEAANSAPTMSRFGHPPSLSSTSRPSTPPGRTAIDFRLPIIIPPQNACQRFKLATVCLRLLLLIQTAQMTLRITFIKRRGTQIMGFKTIITGATGMVGEGVLLESLRHPAIDQILVINRKPGGVSHPKLREITHTDFFNLAPIEPQLAGFDACFFCLGVSSVDA